MHFVFASQINVQGPYARSCEEHVSCTVASCEDNPPGGTRFFEFTGCELFSRYVTRTSLDILDFDRCKARLIERGDWFASMSMQSRARISVFGDRFIHDGSCILLHGRSRVVTQLLLYALKQGKNFDVVVTEGRPECQGY